MKTTVILPTLGRAEQMRRCAEHLLHISPEVHLALCVTEEDFDSITSATELWSQFGDRMDVIIRPLSEVSAVAGWNAGLRAFPNSDVYVLGADDLWFYPSWYRNLERTIGRYGGLVGFNDLSPRRGWASHYAMTRQFIIRHHGGVMAVPHYRAWYLDVEACERAKLATQFVIASDVIVEHRHVNWKKATMDSTYERGYVANGERDKAIYNRRKALKWPNDYPAILSD